MKRFLMIAYYYPPMGDGGVFRNLKFTHYLPEHGWRPSVAAKSSDSLDRCMRRLEQLIRGAA